VIFRLRWSCYPVPGPTDMCCSWRRSSMTRFRHLRLAPALLAVVLILTSVAGVFSVRAQDATVEPATPGAEAVASPVAPLAEPWLASDFVSGPWRVEVVTAKRANAFSEYDLESREDKD